MRNGWIKLYRNIQEWEFYKDTNTKALFIHLLLNTNHADYKTNKGNIIKKGYCQTSVRKLSEETGLSIQNVRTCLKKLESGNQIKINNTNKYSIIEIINWEKYQESEREVSKRPTNWPKYMKEIENYVDSTGKIPSQEIRKQIAVQCQIPSE